MWGAEEMGVLLWAVAAAEYDAGRPYPDPDVCVVGLVLRERSIASLSCGDNMGFSPPPLKKVSADPPPSFDVDIGTGLPISRFNIIVLLTADRLRR